MLKVFLVEDEVIIRNGIKNSINWEKENLIFAGEASDGELAYPLVKKMKPDILITDIKMPFMDGIELSQAVQKILPDIKIIILSGYGEFGYAQKAINIGIEKYLLKPISSAQLLAEIKDIANQIEKSSEEKRLMEQYAKEMQENEEHKKYLFFSRLMSEEMPVSQILEEGRELGMDLSAENYCSLFFKVRQKGKELVCSKHAMEAEERIRKISAENPHIYFYQKGIEGAAFLMLGDGEEALKSDIHNFIGMLERIAGENPEIEYFGSVGCPVSRLSEVKVSYMDANKRYARRLIEPWNRVLTWEDEKKEQEGTKKAEVITTENVVSMNNSRKSVEKFLKIGTVEEAADFAEAYLEDINKKNLESFLFRQYISMDLYFCIADFEETLGLKKEEQTKTNIDMNHLSDQIKSVKMMQKYLTQLLKNSIMKRDEKAGRRYSDIIHRACSYMKGHYMEEEISLNTVAAYVNMSPSYFSSVFSKEVKQTFIEYLTQVRMEKAKELLMCSSKRASEIAYEIGYKDSHYFSYIFRKTQNCSPKEFRARKTG